MNKKLQRLSKRIALAAFALVLATSITAAAQSENSAKGLTGTWRVTVALQNCATGAQLGPSFSSLLSFNRGGTMTGTTTNPTFAPGQRSSDLGVWDHKGQHNYLAASEAYINFTAGQFQQGTQRIAQAIHVDGNEFLSNATVQFMDGSGTVYRSACAVAHGTRFE